MELTADVSTNRSSQGTHAPTQVSADAPPAAPIDVLTRRLTAARRRSILANLLDGGAVTLPCAAALFLILRFMSLPSLWIFPAGLLGVAVAVWLRRPTVLQVAARLDADADTAELLSSAWTVRGDADPWAKVLIGQAASAIGSISHRQPWGRLLPSVRGSLALAGAAVCLGSLLIVPADSAPSAVRRADAHSASAPEATVAAAATWAAPSTVRPSGDESDKGGRPIPMQGTAAAHRSGDDAAGQGRSDAGTAVDLINHAPSQPAATAAGNRPATGDGPAAGAANAGSPDANTAGRVSKDMPRESRDAPFGSNPLPRPAGDHASADAAPLAYRAMIEAYFAR